MLICLFQTILKTIYACTRSEVDFLDGGMHNIRLNVTTILQIISDKPHLPDLGNFCIKEVTYYFSPPPKDFSILKNQMIWLPLIWIIFLLRKRWKSRYLTLNLNDVDKRIYQNISKRIVLFPKVLMYILLLAMKNKGKHKCFSDIKESSKLSFFHI